MAARNLTGGTVENARCLLDREDGQAVYIFYFILFHAYFLLLGRV